MPLRALLDGQDVHADALRDDAWRSVREASHAGRLSMPCCGSLAICRVSPLGTKHFVHLHADPSCGWRPETPRHLELKSRIARTCERLGYRVRTEATGPGWRADVLASKEHKGIAFEVQLSHATTEELEDRQRAYQADGVHGCWFVRRSVPGPARRELPVFTLGEEDTVRWFRRSVPLDDFVDALLRGRIQFCSDVVVPWRLRVEVDALEVPCNGCGAGVLALRTRGQHRMGWSRCGWGEGDRVARWPRGSDFPPWFLDPRVDALDEIPSETRLQIAADLRAWRAAPTVSEDGSTVSCAGCGARVPSARTLDAPPDAWRRVGEYAAEGWTPAEGAHWCWPKYGSHCLIG